MSTKAHRTGSMAVHLACVKLIEAGHTVTITSRNAPHVDVLSFREGISYSFQVKANSHLNKPFWLLSKNYDQFAHSTFYYIFINLDTDISKSAYFTVSSADIKMIGQKQKSKKTESVWYYVALEDVISHNTGFDFTLKA